RRRVAAGPRSRPGSHDRLRGSPDALRSVPQGDGPGKDGRSNRAGHASLRGSPACSARHPRTPSPILPPVRFDPSPPSNFDLVRFAEATLVLIDHSYPLTGRPGHPGPFGYETLGGFSVAAFFIISGFLVAASWERAPRVGAFMLKRALRIIP